VTLKQGCIQLILIDSPYKEKSEQTLSVVEIKSKESNDSKKWSSCLFTPDLAANFKGSEQTSSNSKKRNVKTVECTCVHLTTVVLKVDRRWCAKL